MALERLVESDVVAAGDRLPPIRELAALLGVSPGTVSAAYRMLRYRGVAHGEGSRGTRVNDRPSRLALSPLSLPVGVRNLATGSPDPELTPDLRAALHRMDLAPVAYGDPAELPALLGIVRGQFETDGIAANALTAVSGALDGIERTLRAHLRAGDRVLLEDPCFPRTLALARSLALVPVPVRIDDHGPIPTAVAAALKTRPAAFVLTPRAQNPTGAAMDPQRCIELREVLDRQPDLLLVEDDHASLVAGAPAVTLVDGWSGPWAVVRSFAKPLGPDLRLAVVAGDQITIARVASRHELGPGWVSHLLQAAAAWLLSDPATVALLGRALASYSERRNTLLEALAVRGVEAHGVSGFNVWVPVAHEIDVARRLLEAGWMVSPGEYYRIVSGPAIRITIATLREGEATALADVLADVAAYAPTRTVFA
ncbi:MAG TPA: aminotransferase class I/II-fold pyridoxal phosphate-dependent enzyme [Solirubrobacteraceae bacterium]|nr:aminotransferase class I/II-fold pyridoxal phosphate-dependent enzyme [Solirubrobacteraceae bacterium]